MERVLNLGKAFLFLLAAYLLDGLFVLLLFRQHTGLFSEGYAGIIALFAVYFFLIFLFCRHFALSLAEHRSDEIVYYNFWMLRIMSAVILPLGALTGLLDRAVSRIAELGTPERDEEDDVEDFDRQGSSPPLEAPDGSIRLPWFAVAFEGRYLFKVYALDQNWFDYTRTSGEDGGFFGGLVGDNFERPQFNLVGGIGLFGAAAVDSVGFYVLPRPEE